MTIHTSRLILVPLDPKYLVSTHAYANDIENTKYMVHLPNADIEETRSFLEEVYEEWQKENPVFYEFAILLGQEHIGAVSIYLNQENNEGELGWIINKKYWGRGYATEGASAIVKFAHEELDIRRFIAHCDSENISSYKVMEKLGLSLAGRMGGRKNRGSEEEREDLMYLLQF